MGTDAVIPASPAPCFRTHPTSVMHDSSSTGQRRHRRACGAPPHALPGLLGAASWAEQEEGKSGQRQVRPARPTGRGPFLLTNASSSGSRCGGVSGSLEERKGFMPQLILSLESTVFCHLISRNEGQRQQHYHFPMAKVAFSRPLGWTPTFSLAPLSPSLSHSPFLTSHYVWSAYFPDIF